MTARDLRQAPVLEESAGFLDCAGLRTFYRLLAPGPAARPAACRGSAVVLHGAGRSDVERHRTLLADLAARGLTALGLDFAGHGRSPGDLREQSLRARFRQAREAVRLLLPGEEPLLLLGFSMSGQTVADLAGHYGRRVAGIALLAPAVYARAAWPLPFGDGFTPVIRTPGSWRDSRALDVLADFTGTAVLGVPGSDEVIPAEVTARVAEALGERSRFRQLVFPEADHRLGGWLAEHPADRRRLIDALTAGAPTAAAAAAGADDPAGDGLPGGARR